MDGVSEESVVENISTIMDSHNINMNGMKASEIDLYKHTHRYYSSLIYYSSICDKEKQSKLKNTLTTTMLKDVKDVVFVYYLFYCSTEKILAIIILWSL